MVFTDPLEWPVGWPRDSRPRRANFANLTLFRAAQDVESELRRLGARSVVITTNLRIKQDGMPYSNQRNPEDAGVAVYFSLDGRQQCFPCDRWDRIEHNLRAICKSIEALRGLERWGSKHMVNAAFEGFKALPPPSENPYSGLSASELKAKLREHHPDTGDGDTRAFESVLDALRSTEADR